MRIRFGAGAGAHREWESSGQLLIESRFDFSILTDDSGCCEGVEALVYESSQVISPGQEEIRRLCRQILPRNLFRVIVDGQSRQYGSYEGIQRRDVARRILVVELIHLRRNSSPFRKQLRICRISPRGTLVVDDGECGVGGLLEAFQAFMLRVDVLRQFLVVVDAQRCNNQRLGAIPARNACFIKRIRSFLVEELLDRAQMQESAGERCFREIVIRRGHSKTIKCGQQITERLRHILQLPGFGLNVVFEAAIRQNRRIGSLGARNDRHHVRFQAVQRHEPQPVLQLHGKAGKPADSECVVRLDELKRLLEATHIPCESRARRGRRANPPSARRGHEFLIEEILEAFSQREHGRREFVIARLQQLTGQRALVILKSAVNHVEVDRRHILQLHLRVGTEQHGHLHGVEQLLVIRSRIEGHLSEPGELRPRQDLIQLIDRTHQRTIRFGIAVGAGWFPGERVQFRLKFIQLRDGKRALEQRIEKFLSEFLLPHGDALFQFVGIDDVLLARLQCPEIKIGVFVKGLGKFLVVDVFHELPERRQIAGVGHRLEVIHLDVRFNFLDAIDQIAQCLEFRHRRDIHDLVCRAGPGRFRFNFERLLDALGEIQINRAKHDLAEGDVERHVQPVVEIAHPRRRQPERFQCAGADRLHAVENLGRIHALHPLQLVGSRELL